MEGFFLSGRCGETGYILSLNSAPGSTQVCLSAIPFGHHGAGWVRASLPEQGGPSLSGMFHGSLWCTYVLRSPTLLSLHREVAGFWQMAGGDLPVLQREPGQLPVVVQPFELQWPAALSHACEHQAVPFQMHLCAHWLRLEVWRYIICGGNRYSLGLALAQPHVLSTEHLRQIEQRQLGNLPTAIH